MGDFHVGFLQEREFNTQLPEDGRPSLDILKNTKETGLLASIGTVWRGVCVLKQEGKKENACKPHTLVEKLSYNPCSPEELMNLRCYNDKSRGHSVF